jgi:hypothetical protein
MIHRGRSNAKKAISCRSAQILNSLSALTAYSDCEDRYNGVEIDILSNNVISILLSAEIPERPIREMRHERYNICAYGRRLIYGQTILQSLAAKTRFDRDVLEPQQGMRRLPTGACIQRRLPSHYVGAG